MGLVEAYEAREKLPPGHDHDEQELVQGYGIGIGRDREKNMPSNRFV